MSPAPLPKVLSDAAASGSLEETLTATLRHFGAQAGTIHLWEEGVLKLRASIGIPPPVVAVVQTVPLGKGIAGLAAERRTPVTICNLQTDDSGQARPGAKATGMEGALAVPMLTGGGELRGVFGIAKVEAYTWSDEETALVTQVAAQLAEAQA